MKTEFYDRLLPIQGDFSNLYTKGQEDIFKDMFNLVSDVTNIDAMYKSIKLNSTDMFTQEEMGSNPVQLKFLQMLLNISGAKRVLEIGTFIGFSAMFFSKAIPVDGEIITVEKFDKFAAVAEKNFQENSINNVKLIVGDAYEVLSKGGLGKFDFIFLDGNKEKYDEYFSLCKDMINENGIIVIDDVFFHGDVLNETPETSKGKGVKRLLMNLKSEKDFTVSIVPVGNGLAVVKKR